MHAKISGRSIYFAKRCTIEKGFSELLEFDLATRCEKIIHRIEGFIKNYCIIGNTIIVQTYKCDCKSRCDIYHPEQTFWNGNLIEARLNFSRFIKTVDEEFLTDNAYNLYDCNGLVKLDTKVPRFISSWDGKRIVFAIGNHLFEQNLTNITRESLFKDGLKKFSFQVENMHRRDPCKWISNTNYIQVEGKEFINPKTYNIDYTEAMILNLDTLDQINFKFNVDRVRLKNDHIHLAKNGMILDVRHNYLTMYNPKTQTATSIKLEDKTDKKPLKLIGYDLELDVLITTELQYYRIHKFFKKYKLIQVN